MEDRPETDEKSSDRASRRAERPMPRKLTRAEKNARTKENILRAAARLIGENGYSNTSISRITAEAEIAQGTFYNYFSSQQDLFDQLLPTMGAELLGFIKGKTSGITDPIERERQGFVAFFEFLKRRPEFYRILYEAEVFAPQAYLRHIENISSSYVRALERDFDNGKLSIADKAEIEFIVLSLIAVRQYLCMKYARRNGKISEIPEWVVDSYIRMLTQGVFATDKNQL